MRAVKPQNPTKTLKRLFSYYLDYKILIIVSIIALFVSIISEIAIKTMLSPIIDSIVASNWEMVVKNIIITAIFIGILAISQHLGLRIMSRTAQKIVYTIRKQLFERLQKLPVSFFDNVSDGDVMSSFTNDIDMLTQTLEQSVAQFVMTVTGFIGTVIFMFIVSKLLTLIVLGVFIVMLITIKLVGAKSAKYYRLRQANIAQINGYVEEMITGQKVVKVYNQEEENIRNFENRNEELRRANTLAATFGVLLFPVMGNMGYILYALVAAIGGYQVISGVLTIGNIVTYLQYTRSITGPITQVSNQFNLIFVAIAGAERIFNILDMDIAQEEAEVRLVVKDGKKYWREPLSDGSYRDIEVKGNIVFEDVSFGYTPDREILHNISIFAKPGQKIALVGSTGAGKTTVTNLINRFYEINSGTIYYDSIDIRRISPIDLRETLSVVLQDVHLFEMSVKENIRYGRLDATDEEVYEAAKLANCDKFIRHLPQGYDTVLSQDATNLSQGQRQLISIARAAIKNPAVLILDEATSSVDTRTERLIEKAMDRLMNGRTTFVIAHRLSTVRRSNAIMVMENGSIIERGDHDDLMKQGGRYYQLNMGTIEMS